MTDSRRGFWFFSIDPFILGVYRMLLGVVILGFLAILAPTWIEYYGANGISMFPNLTLRESGPRTPWLFLITTRSSW